MIQCIYSGDIIIEDKGGITLSICNRCGKNETNEYEQYQNINLMFGYGSKHDMEEWNFSLCDDCLVEIIRDFKFVPKGFKVDNYIQLTKEQHQNIFEDWKRTGKWEEFNYIPYDEFKRYKELFSDDYYKEIFRKYYPAHIEERDKTCKVKRRNSVNKHNYIIAITGKSSSGKDSIARVLANQYEYKYVVSTTTRPKRSNEINHMDYHFISDKEFQGLINSDKLVEYRNYNTIENGLNTIWHYGIEREEIDLSKHSYCCVVDLAGLEDLKREFNYKVISLYIDVPEKIRKLRAIARDRFFEKEEFVRRCKDDDIKFANVYNVVDFIIRNDNFDECLVEVLHCIDKEQEQRTYFTQYASY